MRALLMHVGPGYSLRETAARVRLARIAEVSDVALLKRLRQSEGWLRALCLELLQENGILPPCGPGGLQVRVVDATNVKEPGKTGSQWRLHYSLRIPDLVCDYVEITPCQGEGNGETFTRFPVQAEELILGDRGYCTPRGISYLRQSRSYVLVRVNTGALPLLTPTGERFPLLEKIRTIRQAGVIREWEVVVAGSEGACPGRLCVLRKSQQACQQAQRRLRRRDSKRQQRSCPESYEFAKYVMVFTTLPRGKFSSRDILEWYRFRWQIELVFKRLKSLAQLGHLPKYDAQSSRAWLYGKLFVTLLTQKLIRVGRDFSPWGYYLPEA
jgi:hypothetical protein